MAWTLQQYEALQAAIADGALTVKYADKTVTYRSLDEMIRILNMIAGALGLGTATPRRTYASFSKGHVPGGCGCDSCRQGSFCGGCC